MKQAPNLLKRQTQKKIANGFWGRKRPEMRMKSVCVLIMVIFLATLSFAGCQEESKDSSSGSASSKSSSVKASSRETSSVSDEQNDLTSEDSSDPGQTTTSSPGESTVTSSTNSVTSPDETISSGTKRNAEITLNPNIKPVLSSTISFALYHNAPGQWKGVRPNDPEEKNFITTYRTNDIEDAKIAKANGQDIWLMLRNPFSSRNTEEFNDSWAETMLFTAESYQIAGVWDTVVGFELEEMLLGNTAMTSRQFIKMTRFLAENFPDKRILAVCSKYEVDGYADGLYVTPMDYETYGFVTDIGYDWYGGVTYEEHKALVEKIKRLVVRPVRIWFFPSTHQYAGNFTEDQMLSHLEISFRLLKEQENPGGMFCYTWETFGREIGLDRLIDPKLEYKHERLAKRILEIGAEIKAMNK